MHRIPLLLTLSALLLASGEATAQRFWNCSGDFTTGYVAVPHAPELAMGGSWSIECWVRPVGSAGIDRTIVCKRISATSGYLFYLKEGKISLYGREFITGSKAVPMGVWSHVAMTFDWAANVFVTYINGVEDTTIAVAAAFLPTTNTDTLYIGRYGNVGIPFRGELDDLRIWDHALQASEIRNFWRMSFGVTGGRAYEGLVASYSFDRNYGGIPTTLTTTDQSGSGNSGYNRGAPVVYWGERPPTRVSDQLALDLDGDLDYAAGPSASAIDITGSFSLECWVYPRSDQTLATLIQKREGSNPVGYTLYLSGGKPAIRTNSTTRLLAATAIQTGRWTHIAATYEAGRDAFSIYLDGELDTSHVVAAPPASSTDSLYIGNGVNGAFDGYMDEVRICDYAKTPAQIRATLWRSVDQSNDPSGSSVGICYNMDGMLIDNASDGGPRLRLCGDAHFTTSWAFAGVPQAPVLRADANAFPAGFFIKNADRRIPYIMTSGSMRPDSLYVSSGGVTIGDVELFLALNHYEPSELTVTLVSPRGDSVDVFVKHYLAGYATNIVTIFDDDADSLLSRGNQFLGFGPTIHPRSSLRAGMNGGPAYGYWKLLIKDDVSNGSGRLYAWGLRLNNATVVGVEEDAEIPGAYGLSQNFPNPFNPTTTIRVELARGGPVSLIVYDILGREVARLLDDVRPAGVFSVPFDGKGCASGVYLYRLQAAGVTLTKRMLLLK